MTAREGKRRAWASCGGVRVLHLAVIAREEIESLILNWDHIRAVPRPVSTAAPARQRLCLARVGVKGAEAVRAA